MKTTTAFRALGIGAVCGLRTMTGPASVLSASKNGWARVLPLLALGELIADKLPNIPSRTMPPALAARAVSGGLCGWFLATADGESGPFGAALGVAGAVAGTFLGSSYRAAAAKAHIPDLIPALFEDAVAGTAGLALARRSSG